MYSEFAEGTLHNGTFYEFTVVDDTYQIFSFIVTEELQAPCVLITKNQSELLAYMCIDLPENSEEAWEIIERGINKEN